MTGTFTYPGVYIQEIPSGVRTIAGVSTSDTAFVDFFARGPVKSPTRITSFDDFERQFGGLDARSEASYGIRQFFLNGGAVAWVVRVDNDADPAALDLLDASSAPAATITVKAANPGAWGNNLQVAIDYKARDTSAEFNLVVREVRTVRGRPLVASSETHRNLSMDKTSSRYAPNVVNVESVLLHLDDVGIGGRPAATGADVTAADVVTKTEYGSGETSPFLSITTSGTDGTLPITSDSMIAGMQSLDGIAPFIFNILCLPGAATLDTTAGSYTNMMAVYDAAQTYCEQKRAFLIVDLPSSGVETSAQMIAFMLANGGLRSANAAVYFPRVFISDPLNENRLGERGASGTIAGVFARTDATRGVWKAPAGTDASLRGVTLPVQITDAENGALNPLGYNALRTFPLFGNVVWGARTLDGADQQASEWKYIPVRRIALYIEESLYQGLKWVVFEPNDEPLWGQIRLNVGAFMQGLFRQGAYQGASTRDAYFVKSDKDTTTQADINLGIVNILVGFAPLKPAEFVVIKLQQMAGQIQT